MAEVWNLLVHGVVLIVGSYILWRLFSWWSQDERARRPSLGAGSPKMPRNNNNKAAAPPVASGQKPKPTVIFVGNPGVGKSLLCNVLFRDGNVPTRFKSGLAIDRITEKLQVGETEAFHVIDVPGLFEPGSDTTLNNAQEIKKALETKGAAFSVVFVVTLEGACIRAADMAMMRAVCNAFKAQPTQLAVVVNKVPNGAERELFTVCIDDYLAFFSNACSANVSRDRIVALQSEDHKTIGKDNLCRASLDALKELLVKVTSAPITLTSDIVVSPEILKTAEADAKAAEKLSIEARKRHTDHVREVSQSTK